MELFDTAYMSFSAHYITQGVVFGVFILALNCSRFEPDVLEFIQACVLVMDYEDPMYYGYCSIDSEQSSLYRYRRKEL
jgi:hypothetical protein